MKYFLAAILVLLLVLVIGGSAFYLGNKSANTQTQMMLTPTPTAFVTQATPTPQASTQDNTKSVKTVLAGGVLVFSAYKLNTNQDWSSQRQQGDNMDTLTLTKGGYKMIFSQVAGGGGGCVYPGDQPSQFAQSFSSFVEIKNPNGFTFRRSPTDATTFTVCQKNASDGSFGFPTNFGNITITTPASVDSKIMGEVDAILASIQKQI